MKSRKFLNWFSKPRHIIALCCLAVCVSLGVFLITREQNTVIPEQDVPLGSAVDTTAADIMEGDALTIRVAAPEVSDLYGYQFQIQYDTTQFTAESPRSLVDDIPTIFKKEFDGYLLVGATMIGDSQGYSAKDAQLCEIKLTALADGAVPDIKLDDVSVVSSDLTYTEDVKGWLLDF